VSDGPGDGGTAPAGDPVPEQLFAGHPVPLAVVDRVRELVGECTVRTSRSQVAFRRRRGFAYVWRPGQYLHGEVAPAVLTVVLGRPDASPRWKEVVQPSPHSWVHHLEVRSPDELDDEVAAWLHEAWARA
jgi:hypothetical protein